VEIETITKRFLLRYRERTENKLAGRTEQEVVVNDVASRTEELSKRVLAMTHEQPLLATVVWE
jgi:hypothetical protein